jgi:hypothetical protein
MPNDPTTLPVTLVVALAALAVGIMRAALPYARFRVPAWLAHSILVLALVLLAVALIGFFVPLGNAHLEFVRGDGDRVDMTWPFAIICAGITYATMAAGARLMRWGDADTRILSPLGGRVDHRHSIYGSVWPPGSDVQLFVFSGDGRWHPTRALVDAASWRLDPGWIGDDRTPSGAQFKLVAVAGAPDTRHPAPKLPSGGVPSQVVSVTRR